MDLWSILASLGNTVLMTLGICLLVIGGQFLALMALGEFSVSDQRKGGNKA